MNVVVQSLNAVHTAATVYRLSRQIKLNNILHELQIDTLPNATPHKQPVIFLVTTIIDIFAENDANLGTTSFTFKKLTRQIFDYLGNR